MPAHEFVFELRLDVPAADLVDEVTAEILARLGYTEGAARDISRPLRSTLDGRGAGCVVQYEARSGQLEITVTSAAQPPWRLARPIP